MIKDKIIESKPKEELNEKEKEKEIDKLKEDPQPSAKINENKAKEIQKPSSNN